MINLMASAKALFVLISIAFTSCDSNKPEVTNRIGILCDIGRKKYDCITGGGLCNCRIVLRSVLADNGNPRTRNIDANLIDHDLYLHFPDSLPADVSEFIFEESTLLNDTIATAFGYKNMSIQPGKYSIKREGKGTYVKVVVDVK